MLRIILMAAPLALAAFGVFMLCRNEWVFRERRRLLNTMPISEGLRLHRSLPDYDVMMRRFWIWDVRRFMQP